MSEKNCENCVKRGHSDVVSNCYNGKCVYPTYDHWQPIPPPPEPIGYSVTDMAGNNFTASNLPEPMVSVLARCPQYSQQVGGQCEHEVDCPDGTTCDVEGNIDVKINPNNSPELIKWAYKYVAEHTSKPIYEMNIKPPTGEKGQGMSLTLSEFTAMIGNPNPIKNLLIDGNNKVWELIGIITDPQVIIKNITTGEQVNEVIGCRNFEERDLQILTQSDFSCWQPPPAEPMGSVLNDIMTLVEHQANDEGLWSVAVTAPEGYLQSALRRLHEVCEHTYNKPKTPTGEKG